MKIWVQILGLALLIVFFSPADSVPDRGCYQCTFPLTMYVCSLSPRLFPAFIVCELVRIPILNGGIWFLVVILFGIPAAIRNVDHHVPWGCVVFYLNFFLKSMRKITSVSVFADRDLETGVDEKRDTEDPSLEWNKGGLFAEMHVYISSYKTALGSKKMEQKQSQANNNF